MRIGVYRWKFDGDPATQMGIFREVNSSHTPLAEGFKNAIM
jgi:hypothetical protein